MKEPLLECLLVVALPQAIHSVALCEMGIETIGQAPGVVRKSDL